MARILKEFANASKEWCGSTVSGALFMFCIAAAIISLIVFACAGFKKKPKQSQNVVYYGGGGGKSRLKAAGKSNGGSRYSTGPILAAIVAGSGSGGCG